MVKIEDLHEVFKPKVLALIAEAKKVGIEIIITSAYRSFEEQKKLNGINPLNAKAGYSKHNFGLAVDINIKYNGEILKKASNKGLWVGSGIVAIATRLGMVWGGNFASYYDPIHFENGGYSGVYLRDLQAKQKVDGNKIVLS